MSVLRTTCLTRPIAGALIESSRTPRPSNNDVAVASPASSPQTPTQRPWCPGGDGGGLDEPEHRWVQRVRQCRDVFVAAIGGEHVLRQVVRADREEVDRGCQGRRRERRGGHLDHDAGLELRAGPDGPSSLLQAVRARGGVRRPWPPWGTSREPGSRPPPGRRRGAAGGAGRVAPAPVAPLAPRGTGSARAAGRGRGGVCRHRHRGFAAARGGRGALRRRGGRRLPARPRWAWRPDP